MELTVRYSGCYIRHMLRRPRWLLLIAFFPCVPSSVLAQGDLNVRVQADQSTYVFREPIKLIVTISNTGSAMTRIPQVSRLGSPEMEFAFFEMRMWDGSCRRAKSVRLNVNSASSTEYAGAPRAPGDSVTFFCYPILTNVAVDSMGSNGRVLSYRTFPTPGTPAARRSSFGAHLQKPLWRRWGGTGMEIK